jgi:serine/threonine protein kinase
MDMVGSKIYMAPEIIKGEAHSLPCDMWSIGIILYSMLSSEYPFNFRNIDDEIINTPVLYMGDNWSDISVEARTFISMCLRKEDSERLTAKKALDHPWFKKF